jgi:dihydroflavonol-4-reductase
MRVLVTGGTGFVGCHVVAAVRRDGHDVRMLARRPERAEMALRPVGVSPAEVEVLPGDVLDGPAVDAAVRGADALINAANVYSLNVRDADRMREVNSRGTRQVLTSAAEHGLAPIVHVSSYVALLPSATPLTSDSPTGQPQGAYLESKAASERIAFELRDQGAPVVVTNPGSVDGPNDPNLGESARRTLEQLRNRAPFAIDGGYPCVDVRDLATAHARLLATGADRPRHLMAGHWTTMIDLVTHLRALTGRRLPLAPLPYRWFERSARLADAAQRRGIDPGFSSMVTYLLRALPGVDDQDTQEALGIRWRPVRETLRDAVAWLYATGRISARTAGAVAATSPRPAAAGV